MPKETGRKAAELPQALRLADELRKMDEAKKYHPSGPGGQMLGCEQYRLIASGFTFEHLQSAAAELRRLHAYCQELESQVIADCMTHSTGAKVEALSAAQAGVPADAAEPTCTACGATLHEVTQSPNSYLSAEQFDADKLGDWYCKCCPQGPSDGSRTHRYFWNSDLVAPALAAAPQPSSSPAPADRQPGDNNVQLDTDSNPATPGQQRDMAGTLEMGQPVGDGQHEAGRHTQAQGDKLLTVAERNLRRFLETAVFRDEADRQAALNCLEVLTTPAPAQPGQERERKYPPLPDFDAVEQHIYGACRRYIDRDMLEPIHNLIRDCIDADRASRAAPQPATADAVDAQSPTAGMNIAQRILHVGGRNNAAGYVEFGSIQAVEALIRQVLRDMPATADALPDEKTCVDYVLRYGGRCRDCADENGICPGSGLPCGGQRKAVTHVVQALRYGLQHGYLRAAQREVKP